MRKQGSLTKAVIAAIAKGVRYGAPMRVSACIAGVDEGTIKDWIKEGNRLRDEVRTNGAFPVGSGKRQWLLADLAEAVEVAHAECVAKYQRVIDKASKKSWAAAAWWLDRHARQDGYGPPSNAKKPSDDEGDQAEKVVVYVPDNGRGPNA